MSHNLCAKMLVLDDDENFCSHNHKTSQTSFFATSFTKEILQNKRDYLEFFHQWGFKANGKI